MNRKGWVDPRIDQVHIEQVRDYMLAHGWQIQPDPRSELLIFEGPLADNGQPFVQYLPLSERLRSYRMRLEELIGALSILEDRPCIEILDDMLASASSNGPVESPRPNGADSATTDRQRT
jgi:hypothetical protein